MSSTDGVASSGAMIGEEAGSNGEVANSDPWVAKCPVSEEAVSREILLFRMFWKLGPSKRCWQA